MASPQEEQGILGAFGSIMDFSRSWAGGMMPFGLGGLAGTQEVPQQQGGIDRELLAAGQAAAQGILGRPEMIAQDAPFMGGANGRVQRLLDSPIAEELEDQEEVSTVAELTAQEWETTPLYKPGDDVNWAYHYPNNPYKKAYEHAVKQSIPTGVDQSAAWDGAKPAFLYAFGAYIVSNLKTDPKDMISFTSFLEGGKVRMPSNLGWESEVLSSASAEKKTGKTVDQWKRENVTMLAGLSEDAKEKLYYTVQDDQQELAVIAALGKITGQGRMGGVRYVNLNRWKRDVDDEPVRTGKEPTPEGYVYRYLARASQPGSSSFLG